ncbi:MAG: DUF6599 family protein [Pseudomonadota bacterium]|nr:DUF6599 family protein [Pseudomonadota bacterium]
MSKTAGESPTAPFGIRALLIALLPILGVLLYLDGQDYDADLVELERRGSAAGLGADAFPDSIAGLERFGQIRRFDTDNLYEYINGHAEFFLGAGFQGLTVVEYGVPGGEQPVLVVNLYHMGEPLNAFGVLVDEAGGSEPVDLGSMGFRSGNGVTLIHGPYYVQISSYEDAVSAPEAGAEMVAALEGVISNPGLAFRFPDLGTVTSTRFVKEDYRGLGFLNGVLERRFERNGEEIEAFLVSGTADSVQHLVRAFETFFREDELPYRKIEKEGLTFYSVNDPYEGDWFFLPLGERLIGVYAPLDEGLAAAIKAFAKGSSG